MQLLSLETSETGFLIIGEGLLGTAVVERLRALGYTGEQVRHSWDASGPVDAMRALVATHPKGQPLQVIWSAGQSGMTTKRVDLDAHRATFEHWLRSTAEILADRDWRLHYLSSAGALGAPGQAEWDRSAIYATIKSLEEEIATQVVDRTKIYRVTSVFGAASRDSRVGIIGVLVDNALQRRETALYARMTTLRNYVYDQDVATAIVHTALVDHGEEPVLLAARRSTSMSEVVATVKEVVRKPVAVRYAPAANDHDMIFDPQLISAHLPDRPLRAAVRRVYDRRLSA